MKLMIRKLPEMKLGEEATRMPLADTLTEAVLFPFHLSMRLMKEEMGSSLQDNILPEHINTWFEQVC